MAYRHYERTIGRVYTKSALNNPRNSPMLLSTTAPPSWSLSNMLVGHGSSSSITTSSRRVTTSSSLYPGSLSLYQWVNWCGHGLARDPLRQPRELATPGIDPNIIALILHLQFTPLPPCSLPRRPQNLECPSRMPISNRGVEGPPESGL